MTTIKFHVWHVTSVHAPLPENDLMVPHDYKNKPRIIWYFWSQLFGLSGDSLFFEHSGEWQNLTDHQVLFFQAIVKPLLCLLNLRD